METILLLIYNIDDMSKRSYFGYVALKIFLALIPTVSIYFFSVAPTKI